jgi:hypothetical protein
MIGSNAQPQKLQPNQSTQSDALFLWKVTGRGIKGRQCNREEPGSRIDHCGTPGLKAIDAARRALETEKRWIDRICLHEVRQ